MHSHSHMLTGPLFVRFLHTSTSVQTCTAASCPRLCPHVVFAMHFDRLQLPRQPSMLPCPAPCCGIQAPALLALLLLIATLCHLCIAAQWHRLLSRRSLLDSCRGCTVFLGCLIVSRRSLACRAGCCCRFFPQTQYSLHIDIARHLCWCGEHKGVGPLSVSVQVGGCAAMLGTHLLSLMPVLACHQAGQLQPGSGQTWDPSSAGSGTSCLQHSHSLGIQAACDGFMSVLQFSAVASQSRMRCCTPCMPLYLKVDASLKFCRLSAASRCRTADNSLQTCIFRCQAQPLSTANLRQATPLSRHYLM